MEKTRDSGWSGHTTSSVTRVCVQQEVLHKNEPENVPVLPLLRGSTFVQVGGVWIGSTNQLRPAS